MYDVIIIGTGCAGYAAAMYAGRLNLKTLVIGYIDGGTIIMTDSVENYPGFIKLTGQELTKKLKKHALKYKKFVELKQAKVTNIQKEQDGFTVKTGEEEFKSKTIIYSTGTKNRKLNLPGENEFKNKGVHTCALCDGAMYKDKIVAVIGGSDSAAKEAILLTQWAQKVYIIYRKEKIRPEPVTMKKVTSWVKKGKIEIISNTNLKEINGEQFVNSVILDKPYNNSAELKLNAVFVDIGHMPQSELAKSLGINLNEKSEVMINRESKTNIPGFFAAGDVVDTKFKQAITGVGEAVKAAYSAYQHIKDTAIIPHSNE